MPLHAHAVKSTEDQVMQNGINKINLHETRYWGLKYANTNPAGPACWRVIDCHDKDREAAVGPIYASRLELLQDLNRYARETWGYQP